MKYCMNQKVVSLNIIPEYKENYKSWKPLALKYLQDYKSGTLDAKTFEKWLKYTSDEKNKI